MNTHPWCRDIERDKAIRAAEDAAASERPALPEWRDLPKRVARLEAMIPKIVSASSAEAHENKGERMRSGQSGFRTERVTLEMKVVAECPPVTEWPWDKLPLNYSSGESVRVVPSAEADAEVDRLRAEVESLRSDNDKLAKDKQFLVDRLRPLNEAIPPMFDSNGDRLPALGALHELIRERDAALARVKELEADRALADQTERNLRSYGEWHSVEGREARAERDALKARVAELEKQLPEGMERCTITFHECGKGHGWLSATNWVQHPCRHCERDALKARVAELEEQRADAEPVAYLVDGPYEKRAFRTREEAYAYRRYLPEIEKQSMQLVPLYRAPPPPRGWLTEEERSLIAKIAHNTREDDPVSQGRPHFITLREAAVARSLLSRNSPPRVRLPDYVCWVESNVRYYRVEEVRAALAAAGVEVSDE